LGQVYRKINNMWAYTIETHSPVLLTFPFRTPFKGWQRYSHSPLEFWYDSEVD